MYSELVDLGHRLEAEGKLPPAGFASYREPIKWLVHLWSDRAVLEPVQIPIARPFSGRTSGIEAHLLADEAAYVLGVEAVGDGSTDKRAARKQAEEFRPLYRAFQESNALATSDLGEAIDWLDRAFDEGWLQDDPHLEEVRAKDWVSIMPEEGGLASGHLYQHADAKAFWVLEMQRRCSQAEDQIATQPAAVGDCAICGIARPLVRKLPLKVKLASATPLHSLNLSAFTSFVGGAAPEKRTHLGMCFNCAELSARAFNYLGESSQNRMQIIRHPTSRDSLTNQYALYWLKAPGPIVANGEVVELTDDDLQMFTTPLSGVERLSESTLNEMSNMLSIPWVPRDSNLNLSDFGFYLSILSPNVGRIALREWLPLSIETVKESLARWLDDTRMVHLHRDHQILPSSITSVVEGLGDVNAEMSRALIHTAYGKASPPRGLLYMAGQRLNTLNALEPSLRDRGRRGEFWNDDWPHALAAAIKLVRRKQRKGPHYMSEMNVELESAAYHCGRLLAVLEEAQKTHARKRGIKKLDSTIVQRGYGGACATPAPVLGRLYRLATMAHLPDAYDSLRESVENISTRIVELGGMPSKLNLSEQADFGLGFYQQRAQIRKERDEYFAGREADVDEA